MKYAADFRQEARAALQGKWPLAILVGLVAAILGGATSGGPEFKINGYLEKMVVFDLSSRFKSKSTLFLLVVFCSITGILY